MSSGPGPWSWAAIVIRCLSPALFLVAAIYEAIRKWRRGGID